MGPLAGYSKLFESRPFELMLNCSPDEAIAIMKAAMIGPLDPVFHEPLVVTPNELRERGILVRGRMHRLRRNRFAFQTLELDDIPRASLQPYCLGTIVKKGSSTAVVGSIRYTFKERVPIYGSWFLNIIFLAPLIFAHVWVFVIPVLVLFGNNGLFVPWRLRVFAGQWDQLAEDLQRMYSGVIVKE